MAERRPSGTEASTGGSHCELTYKGGRPSPLPLGRGAHPYGPHHNGTDGLPVYKDMTTRFSSALMLRRGCHLLCRTVCTPAAADAPASAAAESSVGGSIDPLSLGLPRRRVFDTPDSVARDFDFTYTPGWHPPRAPFLQPKAGELR